MAKTKQLIENTDPDSPESFGVGRHLDSPVARIAATSGFVRSDRPDSNEERWVKKLSNGKEAWLSTVASRDFERPMDFQSGKGGREWELVLLTKKGKLFTDAKQLIRTNEVAMSYVLGAMLQRLATWPEGTPKPTLEGVDDPDDPETTVQREVAARNWEGILLRNGFKYHDMGIRGYERKFGAATLVNVGNSTKPDCVLIGVYYLYGGDHWQLDTNAAVPIRNMVDYINDYVPVAHLQEAEMPVPDPDDPNAAVTNFIQSKTPYLPDYTKLARYIAENKENVYISGKIRRSGRYVHENSTTFDLTLEGDFPEEIGELANVVEKLISEELVAINKKIYRALEREWDHQNSDEYWEEHIIDEWKAELEDMGFSDVDISYSGFSSQGDGASFTADGFDFMKWVEWFMSNKPTEQGHPYTDELWRAKTTESVDDPSKEHMIHMGRSGECPEHCQHCGAYCTLIHYDLNGTQMPQYHICKTCDSPITATGLNNDEHVVESVDDPDTFMASLDKMPDHEMINTSSPTPNKSHSVTCTCGMWSFSGVANSPAEQADFDAQAKTEFDRHTSYSFLPKVDDIRHKLAVRNYVTSRRLKEGYNFPDQGEQDKAEHWADDEIDVDDPSAVIKQEVAKRADIQSLQIVGRRWFRRGIGGTYCTASIFINDKLVHETPIQGGGGDHYLTLAKDWLMRNGYLHGLLDDPRDPIWVIRDRRPDIKLSYYAFDVKRERDL